MRSLKSVVVTASLLGFGVAQAQETAEVRERRSTASVVAMDTLWGGVAGAAVSGGVIGYRMGVQNRSNYDWAPVLGTGIAIGVGAGLLWGILDATTGPTYSRVNGPASDGLSFGETHPFDMSGTFVAPIAGGRF
jgi:hypothetical protein